MNILLTGEIQTGKSTVIRKVTEKHPDWKIGGFITVKAPEGGKAPENWPDGQEFLPDAIYICRAGRPVFSSDLGVVGDCGEFGFPKSFPEVFDRTGKKLVEDIEGYDLIIMDELGFMENEAKLFQEAVFKTLGSGVPVLGVLKKKESSFLNSVRSFPGVKVIEVTEDNRDALAVSVGREIEETVNRFRKKGFAGNKACKY